MNEKILDREKQRILALQAGLVQDERFFLAGGTGLGLRLGHRISRDLDWFTPRAFDATQLAAKLAALPEKPTELRQQGTDTLRAYYGKLETSFLRYTQVVARPEALAVAGMTIPVADVETLAVMKAAAVHDRGTKRDFVDIHAISKMPGWSVGRFMEMATTRLPLQPIQMRLAMSYFADAERDEMPRGYEIGWSTIKSDLQRGVQEWERSRSRELDR
jgi:hypothetical protein